MDLCGSSQRVLYAQEYLCYGCKHSSSIVQRSFEPTALHYAVSRPRPIYSLGPLGHLVAVPAGAVGVRLLHLGVELAAVGEVVHRLEGEGGLIPWEVQRQVH